MPERGRGRGGQERGRGRGGASAFFKSKEPHAPPTPKAYEPASVVTTTTDSGTELPKKLNSKVFIDGLPYEYKPEPHQMTLEEEIFNFVTAWKVGKPVRFIKRPGQGFGFLLFKSPNSVPVAVRVLNGRKFLGRTLRVEEPKLKDQGTVESEPSARDAGKDSYSRQVLLSDLAKVAEPDIIREVLRDVAPQLEGKLETIKMTSKNRKAFLTFSSPEDVTAAVNFLDGFHLLGRKVSAIPAAAPGTLPYSRVPIRTNTDDKGPSRTKMTTDEGDNDAFETVVVPLGVTAPVGAKPHQSKAAAAPVADSRGSNRTGVTEKYNLLDNGPREVYVGNIGENVTVQQLRQHFSNCGKIESCELIVNPNTGLLTGVGKVTFTLPAYAAYAKEHCHGSILRGNTLHVDRGDEANTRLTADHDDEEKDAYDEDEYLRRHGVKDKEAYFKGTAVGAEMGLEGDDEDGEADFTVVDRKRPRGGAEPKKANKVVKRDTMDAFFSDSEDEHFQDVDSDGGHEEKSAPAKKRKTNAPVKAAKKNAHKAAPKTKKGKGKK
ncbi:nucleolin [Angomonas deanei]|uniref:RNA recognition motif. (A.k.a. RRM, RBD, or RNP domain), putative n=1 Tax=Angomonas deanei TaxID=59799 RepID=A0A7G2C298_9TRYP|nr:nucleolin [Angomonas deanei]CAD2213374.1 RNA recognition motif. (a.k.a. RRM, RBD, or RNP domain), putative [Angomonas deanei]|eukprot:EPY23342.1 nucleolin [Angomonas deanei]